MPWTGSIYRKGNYSTNGWTGDAANNIGIEAGRHDTQDNDFQDGISACINKNGANTPTVNLPMGGYKHTGAAAATANGEYLTYDQVNDGSPLKVDFANDRVGINTTSPANALEVIGVGNFRNTTGYHLGAEQYSNDTNGANLQTIKSRGTTVGANGAVAANDTLFALQCYGNHGSGIARAAYIAALVDSGTVSSTSMPGSLLFGTTPNGSTTTTERMRITSSGNIGIGTGTPSNNLTVGDGTGTKSIVANGANSGTAGGSYIASYVAGATKVAIGNYSAINGGAYDAAPTIYFAGGTPRVTGIVSGVGDRFMKWNTANAEWTFDTSSARFKENIVDSQYGLQAVLALRSVEFDYKEPAGRHDVGFIAEEVLNVVPEVVGLDKEGLPEAVMYDRLTSVLCKAIQELNAKVDALKARVAVLEG